jgi:hypothetical protein
MDSPLPKREYNMPPVGFVLPVKAEEKHETGPLQRELQKIRRELLTLAQRVEKLTTGQETA